MIDYDDLAALAGVEWNDEDRYTLGHTATVHVIEGGADAWHFDHPCTCTIGRWHEVEVVL